ncbi:DNA topoisomerase 2-binding protein 1-A [Tetranychus urticae]|uniref:BRCT domain-containing protein n=1 Tax=Tetranychus urticae TaxID=32264 RepID=T1JW73_TETUR|nr:DNA topoisomerase 2-binding protein 1-A [Tetranychus urticae]
MFEIFFLKSQDCDGLRSAYSSLLREVFNPRWIDFSEIDEMISLQENPVLVLDSFESSEFSLLKSKKSLKIFSAFALLSINPRKPKDLLSFKHPHIASTCMKKVSLTFSGISDNSVVSEIRSKTRAMGGIFKPALYAKTTHIVATNWNTEKVKHFRKANKPVMRPGWVFRCWEKREDILDIKELDPQEFTLPVFAGMNICVSGFEQRERIKIKQMVVTNGGNWHSGLLLNQYDADTEYTQSTQIDPNNKTTHLVVASKAGDKYKAAMSDPDVKIVNIDWINKSQLQGIPQMEDDPKYCLRDDNAMNELKRAERERKRKQLQSCSQNSTTSTQDNSLPVLPVKKDIFTIIEKLVFTNKIPSTVVFDGLSFCFCGLGTNYHQNVKKLISRFGGIVYNELVSAVTHVIIGPHMTSRDAYNLNRHEEKYRSISKVSLEWVVECAENGKLCPPYFDDKLEKFLEQISSTQDLPANDAKDVAYARALKRADEFTKEIDLVEKLNQNNNKMNPKSSNSNVKSGFRMGSFSAAAKLKIKSIPKRRESNNLSIPVEWANSSNE